MKLTIDKGLVDVAPAIQLGVIEADISEPASAGDELWEDLTRLGENMCEHITSSEQLGQHPAVKATRDAYKEFGKDPSRYRGSAESLMRRLIKGQGLFRVHPIVEINNFISLQTMCPVGSYDRSKIAGDVVFRAGKPGEEYEAIGNKVLNIEGLPVFCDDEGPFGSPTSDSKRTMIQPKTMKVLTVIIAFDGETLEFDEELRSAEQLFKRCLPVESISTKRV